MPTMDLPYDGTVSLLDMCLAIEAVSNILIMRAYVSGGTATLYYVTGDYDIERVTNEVDEPWYWDDYPDFDEPSIPDIRW